MKIILFLTLTMLFISCASNNKRSLFVDSSRDAFYKESLVRYNDKRLNELTVSGKNSLNGLIKCHSGNTTLGLKNLQSKLNSNIKNPEYWLHIGNCYYLDENYPKANIYYQLSIQTAKDAKKSAHAAYNNLGVIHLKLKQYDKALSFLQLAHTPNSQYIIPSFNLAQLYIKFNLFNKAIPILEKLHRKNKLDDEILFSLATAYLLKRNLNKSIMLFTQITPELQKREDIATHFALALFLSGNLTKAQTVLNSQNSDNIDEISKMRDELERKIEQKFKERKS